MSFETVYLFGQVELEIDTEGPLLFEFWTDVPGDKLTLKHSELFNTNLTTPKTRPVNIRLPGATRGKVYKGKISGNVVGRLFGARVWAKAIGKPDATGWAWHSLPMDLTPELYATAGLPMEVTAELYQTAGLPIVVTPEAWSEGPLPMPQPGPIPRWVDLPVDAIE